MLKVTGFLTTQPGRLVDSPYIAIIPHLSVVGKMTCDVNLSIKQEDPFEVTSVGSLGYQDIPVEGDLKEAYDNLILKVQEYIKKDLESKNPQVEIEAVSSSVLTPPKKENKSPEE